MNYSDNLNSAIEALRKARRVLVLTGAGISAESGIPTFRGGGGADTWKGMPFDQLSSARLVEDDLPLLWDWFDYRRVKISQCDPNAAHFTLAKAGNLQRFKSFAVVTQNIDGLHQAAETPDVIELHGSIWRAKCLGCGTAASVRVLSQDERPPVCKKCRSFMRPDVVLFGEGLPPSNMFLARELAEKCDVCLVIGTSAHVYPAASIPHTALLHGATVIEINPEETDFTPYATVSIQERAAKVLPGLFEFLDEPFEHAEEVEPLDIEISLNEIRLGEEKSAVPTALEATEESSAEPADLGFLLNEEFEASRELIFEVAYAKASAQMYQFKPEGEHPFFFVCGTGLAADGETVAEWEPELVASVKEGLQTIAGGDQIFYTEGLFINPSYREEIREHLLEVRRNLPEDDRRKLELFQRPSVDEWMSQTEGRMRAFDAIEAKEAEVSDDATPEERHSEQLSERQFLLFWRDTSVTAHERMGRPINIVSSNQIDGVRRGDILWIATLEEGSLVLCGRMVVGEVVDRFVAEERYGKGEIWKSDLFAIALKEDECEMPRRITLGDTAFELRFMEDEFDRFTEVEGRISRKQTRNIRELTAGSVDLLEEAWRGEEQPELGGEINQRLLGLDPISPVDAETRELDQERLKRFQGCLIGGAVGDALGAAVEFDSIKAIREAHGQSGITDYTEAYGRIGAITDDTQMTLFTAEGLLRAESKRSHKGICYPAKMIYYAYLRWLETQGRSIPNEELRTAVHEAPSWLLDVPGLNTLRAPGTTCLNTLETGRMGSIEEPINDRKGCGGVMRVAPIGLAALDPFRLGAEAAAITHGHPSGYLSAGVLSLAINRVVNGATVLEAIEHAVYDELPKHEGHEETLAACDRAIRLAKSHLGLETTPSTSEETANDDATPIAPMSAEAVESLGAGWIAEEALAIAIYCSLVHENDFQKAILLSVNHSGDSDSTGSITGNILGTKLGVDAIPAHWLERLELRDTIADVSRDLLIGFQSGSDWWNKYPGI